MNCKRFRRNLADEVTNRLTPGEQARMASHRAMCPECDRCYQAERVFHVAWQELPNDPAPDILPRLAARLGSPAPESRPRRTGRFVYLAAAGVAAGALALVPWTQKRPGAEVGRSTVPPAHRSVAVAPAAVPLSEMLTEVRWRSSEERNRQEEPSYNAEMRALLLPAKRKLP